MDKKIEEKILLIESNNMISGTTNNFYCNIGNIVDKKLKVELVYCVINKNYIAVGAIAPLCYCHYQFNFRIKIFIDFGVGNNCFSNYGNSLSMCMIENHQVVSDIPTDSNIKYFLYYNKNYLLFHLSYY